LSWSKFGKPVDGYRKIQSRRRAVILSRMSAPDSGRPPIADADWDERNTGAPQVGSGQPNSALVVELKPLAPGRVLDVGCGEGADALWLARGVGR
jgi:2-polyprenyl-3-methyl-5-hydroxy-6-metoxy-1,4-benzoquinol methylase